MSAVPAYEKRPAARGERPRDTSHRSSSNKHHNLKQPTSKRRDGDAWSTASDQQSHLCVLLTRSDAPSAGQVEPARMALRRTLQQLILSTSRGVANDAALVKREANRRLGAVELLWSDTTYAFYTRLRSATRARSQSRSPATPTASVSEPMRQFLLEEWSFWRKLLADAVDHFVPSPASVAEPEKSHTVPVSAQSSARNGLTADQREARLQKASAGYALSLLRQGTLLDPPESDRDPVPSNAHQPNVLARIVISLGDLARYAVTHHVVLVPSTAAMYEDSLAAQLSSPTYLAAFLYRVAHLLYPASGRAWSQLGALAAQTSKERPTHSGPDVQEFTGPLAATVAYYRAQFASRSDSVAKTTAEQNRWSILKRYLPPTIAAPSDSEARQRPERTSWRSEVLGLHALVAHALREPNGLSTNQTDLNDSVSSAQLESQHRPAFLALHQQVGKILQTLSQSSDQVSCGASLHAELDKLSLDPLPRAHGMQAKDLPPVPELVDTLVAGVAAHMLVRRAMKRPEGLRPDTKVVRQVSLEVTTHIFTLLATVVEVWLHSDKLWRSALLPVLRIGVLWSRASAATLLSFEGQARELYHRAETDRPQEAMPLYGYVAHRAIQASERYWTAVTQLAPEMDTLAATKVQTQPALPEYWAFLDFSPLMADSLPVAARDTALPPLERGTRSSQASKKNSRDRKGHQEGTQDESPSTWGGSWCPETPADTQWDVLRAQRMYTDIEGISRVSLTQFRSTCRIGIVDGKWTYTPTELCVESDTGHDGNEPQGAELEISQVKSRDHHDVPTSPKPKRGGVEAKPTAPGTEKRPEAKLHEFSKPSVDREATVTPTSTSVSQAPKHEEEAEEDIVDLAMRAALSGRPTGATKFPAWNPQSPWGTLGSTSDSSALWPTVPLPTSPADQVSGSSLCGKPMGFQPVSAPQTAPGSKPSSTPISPGPMVASSPPPAQTSLAPGSTKAQSRSASGTSTPTSASNSFVLPSQELGPSWVNPLHHGSGAWGAWKDPSLVVSPPATQLQSNTAGTLSNSYAGSPWSPSAPVPPALSPSAPNSSGLGPTRTQRASFATAGDLLRRVLSPAALVGTPAELARSHATPPALPTATTQPTPAPSQAAAPSTTNSWSAAASATGNNSWSPWTSMSSATGQNSSVAPVNQPGGQPSWIAGAWSSTTTLPQVSQANIEPSSSAWWNAVPVSSTVHPTAPALAMPWAASPVPTPGQWSEPYRLNTSTPGQPSLWPHSAQMTWSQPQSIGQGSGPGLGSGWPTSSQLPTSNPQAPQALQPTQTHPKRYRFDPVLGPVPIDGT